MLKLFIGPMFSGKTTLLLSRVERYKIGGKKCLVIKYEKDDRYDNLHVCSHTKLKHEAMKTDLLQKLDERIMQSDYDVILIDEIQFFKDASYICNHWAKHKIVEVYGLNGDFQQKPFDQISLLIPYADSIQHLTAIDRDNGIEAPFTIRTSTHEEQEVIGGENIYKAVSRENLTI